MVLKQKKKQNKKGGKDKVKKDKDEDKLEEGYYDWGEDDVYTLLSLRLFTRLTLSSSDSEYCLL